MFDMCYILCLHKDDEAVACQAGALIQLQGAGGSRCLEASGLHRMDFFFPVLCHAITGDRYRLDSLFEKFGRVRHATCPHFSNLRCQTSLDSDEFGKAC